MLFTQKSLETLEFHKITEMLVACAQTDGAKNKARNLLPSDDIDTVRRRQAKTADARRLLCAKGYPAFGGTAAAVDAAERAEKGSVLSTRDLLEVLALLRSTRLLLDYIHTDRLFETSLDEVFARLLSCRTLEDKISRAIIAEDTIADEASPMLADVRRRIRNANNKIKDTLQSFINGGKTKYLQENIVTLRNGRYVIPVKSEYRNEIKGLLHDTSSSGSTVFIEPMGVVEANNELRALQIKEQYEIDRILSEFSIEVSGIANSIRLNYLNITDIAFYFAAATLAEEMRATSPVLTEGKRISLINARHPLLPRETVVPISVSLGVDFDTLIVTGPNTGGKTVTLKTLGLLALMAQSGLQIPADESSELCVFEEILVDIGDEQSIEQSLSTFSAHMVNIVNILKEVSPHSLVLFDELGAGTDPVEGAALAIAILSACRKMGALSAATTHYAELKAFALDTDGVQNASCEFDIETLRPTYRLIIGTPGKSNAFAISEKIGLPQQIVSFARDLISDENRQFETVIEKLEAARIEMEHDRALADKERREYEKYRASAEAELKERIEKSEAEIEKTKEKARQLLDSARATSEFVFTQLEDIRKKQEKERSAAELENARREIRTQLKNGEGQYAALDVNEIDLSAPYTLPRPLRVGDLVFLVSFGQEAEVTALPDSKNMVAVKSGILRAKVPLDKLRLLDASVKRKKEEKSKHGDVRKTVIVNFKPEIDVRGNIGDDAWFMIDKYLDDAMVAGVKSVRIIHGKGTGALRAAIQQNLKKDRRIESYRNGVYGEGDLGVTVVELK